MLDKVNPKVIDLQRKIDNCNDLMAIIQNKIDQGHPIHYLDSYSKPCGTVGCVLGDFIISRQYEPFRNGFEVIDACDHFLAADSDVNFFGLEGFEYAKLFGSSENGTYQDRKDYLQAHISTLEAQLAEVVS